MNPTLPYAVEALIMLRPNAQWTIEGDDLSTLQWNDLEQMRPTDDEIISKARELELNPNIVIPKTVTPRQARLVLLQAGLLDQVESSINTVGGSAKITWEYATQIDRDDPLITTLGQSLNLTDQQIDNLFIQAATL